MTLFSEIYRTTFNKTFFYTSVICSDLRNRFSGDCGFNKRRYERGECQIDMVIKKKNVARIELDLVGFRCAPHIGQSIS